MGSVDGRSLYRTKVKARRACAYRASTRGALKMPSNMPTRPRRHWRLLNLEKDHIYLVWERPTFSIRYVTDRQRTSHT